MVILIWAGFIILVLILLALDLGVFHKRLHIINIREAFLWTFFWVALSLIFNCLIYFMYEHNWLGIGNEIGHQLAGKEVIRDIAIISFLLILNQP